MNVLMRRGSQGEIRWMVSGPFRAATMTSVLAALTIAIGATGCGSDSETDGGGGSSATGGVGGTGGSGGAGGASLCAPASGSVELAGQWALLADLSVELRGNPQSIVLLCPDPQQQRASLLMKISLAGGGTSYQQTVQFCDISLPVVTGGLGVCAPDPAQAIETHIAPAPALKAHLPSLAVPETAVELSAPDAGASYSHDAVAVLVGADLANPASDPLPFWDTQRLGCLGADATPAACVEGIDSVIDEERDGRLGATLLAEALNADGSPVISGEAYAVLRIAPELDGTIQNFGCIAGGLHATFAYSIVDSDITLSGVPLGTGAVVQQLPPFEILPGSSFRMLRADATGDNDFDDDADGNVSCAEIQNHRSVFSR